MGIMRLWMWREILDMLTRGHLMNVQISWPTWKTTSTTGKMLFLAGLESLKGGEKIENCLRITGVLGIWWRYKNPVLSVINCSEPICSPSVPPQKLSVFAFTCIWRIYWYHLKILGQRQKGVIARSILLRPGGPLACELARHAVVLKINDWVFCHGGLLPRHGKK